MKQKAAKILYLLVVERENMSHNCLYKSLAQVIHLPWFVQCYVRHQSAIW